MEDLRTPMSSGAFSPAAVTIDIAQRPADFQPVFNPARTCEVVGEVAIGAAEHVDGATCTADAVFPSWSQTPPEKRAELMTCEQIGPVIPILSFSREYEGMELANATESGLCASVRSEDCGHVREVARCVFLNVHQRGGVRREHALRRLRVRRGRRGHGTAALNACT